MSARYLFVDDIQRRQIAAKWIEEAHNLLFSRASEPMASDLEALALISLDHVISRRFAKAMVSTALTARLAYMMRLNHGDGRIASLAQERRTRLMWCIFVFDRFFSSGRAEFSLCPRDTIHLQLPWPEQSFLLDSPVTTEPLRLPSNQHGPTQLGFMALCIRLLDIRDRISRYSFLLGKTTLRVMINEGFRSVQKIIRHRRPLADYLPELKSLEEELGALHRTLPPGSIFTTKNLFLRAYTPRRTTFVMFHIWMHQCHCDLYRFTIPGFREALPADELRSLPTAFTSYCRRQCLKHALGVSKVISSVIDLGKDIFITDPSLAICAFHSARIIFRLGQPDLENLATSEVVTSLAACSQILDTQAEIYPTTKLLQRGIQDLIHDAQHTPRGPSPLRSTWEMEQSNDDGELPLPQSAVQMNSCARDICSKYSIAEEIRKMEFPTEESSLSPSLGHESDNFQGLGQDDSHDSRRYETHDAGNVTQTDKQNQLPGFNHSAESFLNFASQEPVSTPRYDGGWYETGDDLSLMLGLDLDQNLSQADIFWDPLFQDSNSIEDATGLPTSRDGA